LVLLPGMEASGLSPSPAAKYQPPITNH
jgi:hypothetical protein